MKMKVKIESSRIVKPYKTSNNHDVIIPLSVFDNVTYNSHMAVIYAYRPPTPSNSTIEQGLRTVLSEYVEWAGRLCAKDSVIYLNNQGVRFVEASVDCKLDQAMPFKPSMELRALHPSLNGNVEELVQVQLTRFTCGSLVVGFTAHHHVADGYSTSNFLVAWGKACRGIELKLERLPTHDRTSFFVPRDPPTFDFEHRGVEFTTKKNYSIDDHDEDNSNIVVQKVHFTMEFLRKLKAKASHNMNKPYSTFESLVAHLWRTITKARGLSSMETTSVRISVNGRTRLLSNPKIPNNYFGNLVLWAFPKSKVKELSRQPLEYAAKLIHEAVVKVNDDYFKSFIDFASSGKVKEEGLVSTAEMNKTSLNPNLEVDSWLRFPFYELDFGSGSPYIFMPSYYPTEGMMFLLPSFIGDGSIDAFVPLYEDDVPLFKQMVYSLA